MWVFYLKLLMNNLLYTVQTTFFFSSSSLSCRMAAALVAEPKWRAAQLPRAAAAGSEAQKVS